MFNFPSWGCTNPRYRENCFNMSDKHTFSSLVSAEISCNVYLCRNIWFLLIVTFYLSARWSNSHTYRVDLRYEGCCNGRGWRHSSKSFKKLTFSKSQPVRSPNSKTFNGGWKLTFQGKLSFKGQSEQQRWNSPIFFWTKNSRWSRV